MVQPSNGKVIWINMQCSGRLFAMYYNGLSMICSLWSKILTMRTIAWAMCRRWIDKLLEQVEMAREFLVQRGFYDWCGWQACSFWLESVTDIGLDRDIYRARWWSTAKFYLLNITEEETDNFIVGRTIHYLDVGTYCGCKTILQVYENGFILISHDMEFLKFP